jgi:SAM-dependent methyltransferase
MPAVLTTAHTVAHLGSVHLYRCGLCQSLNAEGTFADFEEMADVSWDQYLQVGAGLSFMFLPLERSRLLQSGSLLDIGCGCGFTLDYWTRVAGGPAIGVEPASYADRGISELGVHILKQYLLDADEIKNRTFDRIISSEVIEHVPDPLVFLKELKSFLDDHGVAILTTPSAEYVRKDNPLGIIRSVVSPGMHQFLLSKTAFEALLSQAGFKHVIVTLENERLIAYASDEPLDLLDDRAQAHQNLLTYLRSRLADSPPTSALGLGSRYRLFRELVNLGSLDEAHTVGKDLLAAIRHKYGFDPLDLDESRSRLVSVYDVELYGKAAPFFLPCLLYYLGMLSAQGRGYGDTPPPEDILHCAAELCGDVQRVLADGSQEAAALYWPSVFEEGARRLVVGDRDGALPLFKRVIDGPAKSEPHLLFCGRDENLINRSIIQSGIAKLQSGHPEEAMLLLRSAIDRIGPEGDRALAAEALRLWREGMDLARNTLPGWLGAHGDAPERPPSEPQKVTFVSRIFRGR